MLRQLCSEYSTNTIIVLLMESISQPSCGLHPRFSCPEVKTDSTSCTARLLIHEMESNEVQSSDAVIAVCKLFEGGKSCI